MGQVRKLVVSAAVGAASAIIARQLRLAKKLPGVDAVGEELKRRRLDREAEANKQNRMKRQAARRPPAPRPTTFGTATPERQAVDPGRAQHQVDAVDPAELVQEERDMLTVPGGNGHRLRDQTAGEEAQQIAARQVSMRRNI